MGSRRLSMQWNRSRSARSRLWRSQDRWVYLAEPLERRIFLSGAYPLDDDLYASDSSSEAATLAMERVGQWGGLLLDFRVADGYAYLLRIDRLDVIDVHDPAHPVQISDMQLPGIAGDVEVFGSLAYLAGGDTGIFIVDVSEPANPELVSIYSTTGPAIDVFISDSRAYVAEGDAGLEIIDVHDPSRPVRAGGYSTEASSSAVFISGSLAYVTEGYHGLEIVDVRDPAVPVRRGGYDTPGRARSIVVAGAFAYIADRGLLIIDVSNPAKPLRISESGPGDISGIVLSGTLAYLATGFDGLSIIDVSNPAKPLARGEYRGIDVLSLYVVGSLAYVGGQSDGLQVIDARDPDHLKPFGPIQTGGRAYDVFVSGSFAYVVDSLSGLQIIDIGDPAKPRWVGGLDGFRAIDVHVQGNFAYVAGNGLHIVDVSDPANPVRIGSYPSDGGYADVFISGSLAYLAADNLLYIIDVSDAAHPVQTGMYAAGGLISEVFVADSLAYLADYTNGGMQIIDVSDLVHPVRVGRYSSGKRAHGIFVSGSTAYLAQGYWGLQIVDVSDPRNPAPLGNRYPYYSQQSVFVSGSLAYMTDWLRIAQVLDISDPDRPRLVGSFDQSVEWGYGAASAFVSGSLAYVAAQDRGLHIFRLTLDEPAILHLSTQSAVIDGTNVIVYPAAEEAGAPRIYPLDQIAEIRIDEGMMASVQYTGTQPVELPRLNLTVFSSLRIANNSGPINLSSLMVGAGATLDLGNNQVLVRSDDVHRLGRLIKGRQITTSTAAANKRVAIQQVGPDVRLKYTLNGDVNLDGRINADDYFQIDQAILQKPASPTYHDGDFNFDGKINADDYFLIDQASLNQREAILVASRQAAAPVTAPSASNRVARPCLFSTLRLHKARGRSRAEELGR